MGIEKMRYVNFVGNKDYLDEFINRYVSGDFEMQPEYAMSVLTNIKGLYAYKGTNPATELIRRCENEMQTLGIKPEKISYNESFARQSYDDIRADLDGIEAHYKEQSERRRLLEEEIAEKKHVIEQLSRIIDIDVDLSQLFDLRFFKVRFGRLPVINYKRLNSYVDTLDVIMMHVSSDRDYEYLLYIMPTEYEVRVDGLFNSLLFERIRIPDGLTGTPKEICAALSIEINERSDEVKRLNNDISGYASQEENELRRIYQLLLDWSCVYEIRKYVAFNRESFYLVGWMPDDVLDKIKPSVDRDDNVIVIVDNTDGLPETTKPPTKLRNNAIFKPFETVVTMYGLPANNEIDPTPFIAVIYSLMTGFMFGDVGQGLIFLIAGIIMLRKRSALAGVFFGGGLMAIVFGFMYGSIFSLEDVIKPVMMNPMDGANINTMLVIGIAFGVVLLVLGMILNICNGIKAHDKGRILFDRNGIAGLVFYLVIIGTVVGFLLNGKLWTSVGILAIMILVPFLIIFFKKPLENLVNKHRPAMPEEKGTFFIETFFEMVDMLLSFASNTISFVRLSAFAINHVGLSMAVLILAEMPSGVIGKVVVMIIGNVLIIGLEGLIVGIQGLRLVYYELFSRFYSGDGKPYEPIKVRG